MKGYSIHLGINNPGYNGGVNELHHAEEDARRMKDFASLNGFRKNKLILKRKVTIRNFKRALFQLEGISNNDTLLITFSGHGSKIKVNGQLKETLCFYKKPLDEDSLWQILASVLPEGLKILFIFDCCFSGGIGDHSRVFKGKRVYTEKKIIPESVESMIESHKLEYQERWKKHSSNDVNKFSVKVLAAAKKNQVAYEFDDGGAFTNAIMDLWMPNLKDNYEEFIQKTLVHIGKRVVPALDKQEPEVMNYGMPLREWNNSSPIEII